MSIGELLQQLHEQAEPKRRFFGRRHFVLRYEKFRVYEIYFRHSRNILNRYENLRTGQWFRHIHVIKVKEEYVEFHVDYANPDKGILMATTHLFVDVIPYFSAKLVSFRRPR